MNFAQFNAFIAENWPNLTIGGEWQHLLLCGDVTVAVIHWSNSDKLTGIRQIRSQSRGWTKGKRAMNAVIRGAIDDAIASHEAALVPLKAAKEGRQ